MNMKLILPLCLSLIGFQANAQQASTDPQADANAANMERLLRGGKMSPRERAEVAKAARADANREAGASFLANNAVKPGVVSLASGVHYRILREGTGKRPSENNSVRCRYLATLVDGSPIDRFQDQTPAVMRVAGFLPGLKEAVKLMPIGSKWEVVIPPERAYGEQGYRSVGPNAVIIYVIEILGIV